MTSSLRSEQQTFQTQAGAETPVTEPPPPPPPSVFVVATDPVLCHCYTPHPFFVALDEQQVAGVIGFALESCRLHRSRENERRKEVNTPKVGEEMMPKPWQPTHQCLFRWILALQAPCVPHTLCVSVLS